jgi:hypothetical protein
MLKEAFSGSFHSPELLRRPDSVRMTGLCGVRDVGILVGIRHGYCEATAEQILHPAVSPRLDLGIQDGMSLGMAVPQFESCYR